MKIAPIHVVSLGIGFSLFQPEIIRRGDVSDARYLELGARYPAVVSLGRAGDATLISDRWLITAAHVAMAVRNGSHVRSVEIGSERFEVEEVVIHPLWRDRRAHDLALVRLTRAVSDITPLGLSRDSVEVGAIATLVGHGASGAGNSRDRTDDGRRRGATSRVDSASGEWLYFSFDQPPLGTELEGAPGSGDSGGPAIITVGGRDFVAGVSSAGFDGRNGPGTYGAVDAFTRISSYIGWIDSVMTGKHDGGPEPARASGAAAADTLLPDTPVGRRYAAFLRAVKDDSDSAMTRFVHEHFEEREHQSRPALIPNLRRIGGALRGGSVEAIELSQPLQLRIRFKTGGSFVTLELLSSIDPPNRLVDWRRSD